VLNAITMPPFMMPSNLNLWNLTVDEGAQEV
jgi:hypothetical protein